MDVVDFDEVLSLVGDLGRYQKWLFMLVCIPASMPAAVTIFSHIFVSEVPEHHCRPFVSPETASLLTKSLAEPQDFRWALNSLFLPREKGGFSQCQQYDIDVDSVINQLVKENEYINSTILDDFVARNRWPVVRCHRGWEYDTYEYSETLATKFDVVCDQEWLISTAQSVFFLGGVLGSVVFGWISDRWGRRPGLFLATAVMVLGNIAGAFPPNYLSYIIIRFIVGLSYPSVYGLAILLVAEMIGAAKRMSSSIVCATFYALGMMLLAYVAHFTHHWQLLQLVNSVPMLLLLGYYWVVPESPRWLIAQGRVEEAEVIVQKMARVNGVPLPSNFLLNNLNGSGGVPPRNKESAKDGDSLLKYPRVMMKLAAISTVWTIVGMVCHGMSFAAPILPSDTYFAFFLSGLCEIPGILFALATMQRCGRKSTMLWTMFLSGVFSAATAIVPEDMDWLAVLFPSLAKLSSSVAFAVVYVYAGELFPTVIRGFAVGVASTASQIGMVATPYIMFLGGLYGRPVPFLVLGCLGVFAAVLMATLPETLNVPLPTTMDESEHYADYVKQKRARRESRLSQVSRMTRNPTSRKQCAKL